MKKYTQAALILLVVFALSACDLLNKVSLGPDAKAYGEAWDSRDVDKILALHHEDSLYQLHVANQAVARGKAEIRDAFATIFEFFPDYDSTLQHISFGSQSVTIRFSLSATPTQPYIIGNKRFIPTGDTFSMDMMDELIFENGLVKEKHSYMDMESLYLNSKRVEVID
ncbi:nuclear transport factor 2 family protein [Pseudoteredinibacter isoporae]|uniref:nuclear transport factor 2 family protein n=1 Tax=Pseudoteredinibacter isoporae TaxID=570281 RepID=UPI0031087409